MSHRSDITAYLKKGGTLTPLKALKLFDCLSLSQRISEIRGEIVGTKWALVERIYKVGKKRIKAFEMKKTKEQK